MNGLQKTIAVVLTIYGIPGLLYAQLDVHVAGRQIQIHGSFSEGFAYSNQNNFLRMGTSNGSFFTEGALSASSKITDKLRVGVQVYDRYFGELGKGKVY